MFDSIFSEILQTALSLYFGQEGHYKSLREVPLDGKELSALTGQDPDWEEIIVLLLALMPHLNPQTLDLFFILNKNLDRPYTEFGGWKGSSHKGFLPTGETAAFLLSLEDPQNRLRVMQLFGKEHWFYRQNILHLEEQGKGEPFLSGKLCVSEEFLAKVLKNKNYKPDYSTDFPAKLITTPLDWNDLIVTPSLMTELENISGWLCHAQEIRSRWNLDKYIKPGYRCLFYGPPGTGKTLTASLLGKQHGMDVYRIDVSLITAACTAETEKNIARIFDFAEQKNWILFFDKADKLMEMNSEYALQNRWEINNEIRSYLLQRIEDFPGMIMMAITHPKDNPVKAFSTNFQSVLYFPMPDQDTRLSLWKQMIPDDWLQENREELLRTAAEAEISGGCIVNVIRRCALALYKTGEKQLTSDILLQALSIENQSSAFNPEKSSSKLSDQTP